MQQEEVSLLADPAVAANPVIQAAVAGNPILQAGVATGGTTGLGTTAPTLGVNITPQASPILGGLNNQSITSPIGNFATTAEPVAGFGAGTVAPDFSSILASDAGDVPQAAIDTAIDTTASSVIPAATTDLTTSSADAAINAGIDSTASSSLASNLFSSDTLSGIGSFLTTPSAGSLLNLPSDVGNLFSSGADLASAGLNIASDVANPIAGFAGNFAAGLVDKGAKPAGASIGSSIGGAVGSVFGPIGTLAGSFLGHIAGGLFGPNPANTYSSTGLIVNPDGTLKLGRTVAQKDANVTAEQKYYGQQVDALNQFLQTTGLRIANKGSTNKDSLGQTGRLSDDAGALQLGINTPGGYDDPTKFSSLAGVFPKLQFASNDPDVNKVLAGQSFSDFNSLVNTLQTGQPPPSAAPPPSSAPPPPSDQSNTLDTAAVLNGTQTAPPGGTNPDGSLQALDPTSQFYDQNFRDQLDANAYAMQNQNLGGGGGAGNN